MEKYAEEEKVEQYKRRRSSDLTRRSKGERACDPDERRTCDRKRDCKAGRITDPVREDSRGNGNNR